MLQPTAPTAAKRPTIKIGITNIFKPEAYQISLLVKVSFKLLLPIIAPTANQANGVGKAPKIVIA